VGRVKHQRRGRRAPLTVQLPDWPGRLAHERAGDDAIYVQDRPVLGPGDPVDLWCPGCVAGSEISLDHGAELLIFVIRHQRGCSAINDRLQLAGVST
jgi:hypothetical protein